MPQLAESIRRLGEMQDRLALLAFFAHSISLIISLFSVCYPKVRSRDMPQLAESIRRLGEMQDRLDGLAALEVRF
jgi:hypothetical protein